MRYIFLFILTLGITACNNNLRPFSQSLYEEHGWSESELKRVQFYLSDEIQITRKLSGGTSEIIAGDIKVVNGERVEIVTIPRGTPGVLLAIPRENRFAVSFEEGGDDRFLMFGPNPKARNEYKLLASKWEGSRGRVNYDGRYYWTTPGDQLATLLVDMKRIEDRDVKKRTAQGRRVRLR